MRDGVYRSRRAHIWTLGETEERDHGLPFEVGEGALLAVDVGQAQFLAEGAAGHIGTIEISTGRR